MPNKPEQQSSSHSQAQHNLQGGANMTQPQIKSAQAPGATPDAQTTSKVANIDSSDLANSNKQEIDPKSDKLSPSASQTNALKEVSSEDKDSSTEKNLESTKATNSNQDTVSTPATNYSTKGFNSTNAPLDLAEQARLLNEAVARDRALFIRDKIKRHGHQADPVKQEDLTFAPFKHSEDFSAAHDTQKHVQNIAEHQQIAKQLENESKKEQEQSSATIWINGKPKHLNIDAIKALKLAEEKAKQHGYYNANRRSPLSTVTIVADENLPATLINNCQQAKNDSEAKTISAKSNLVIEVIQEKATKELQAKEVEQAGNSTTSETSAEKAVATAIEQVDNNISVNHQADHNHLKHISNLFNNADDNVLANLALNQMGFGVMKIAFSTSPRGRKLLWANDACYGLMGFTQKEYNKFALFDKPRLLIHPDDFERYFDYYEDHFNSAETLSIQYRILHKLGHYVWVDSKSIYLGSNETGSLHYFVSLLMDVTAERKLYDALDHEQRKHELNSDYSTEMLFIYDVQNDSIERLGNYGHYVKESERMVYNYLKSDIYKGYIHSDDIPMLSRLFRDGSLINKDSPETIKFRRKNINSNDYLWHTCLATAYIDRITGHTKILGKIVNIEYDTKRIEHLKKQSKLDELTQLFNADAMRRHCLALLDLDGDEEHALLLIDIDNFAALKQSCGEVVANDAIKVVGRSIRNAFRRSDYLARMHDSKFAIMLKNVNAFQAEILALQLKKQIMQERTRSATTANITTSIGIASYPFHATDFEHLYESGTNALHKAQSLGKDQLVIQNNAFN